ncbi:MAG: penicillin-binding protein 2 [Oceanococcaceae bacterium]
MSRLWRMRIMAGTVMLLLVACGLRAVELQVRQQDFLRNEGERRHVRVLVEPGQRGAIRDRHGEVLALSAPSESIWVVPSALLEDADKIEPLAQLLGQAPAALRSQLEQRSGRQFYYLARQQPPAVARRILALEARGVFLQREYRRFYPAAEAAASLVGLANIDGHGQEGLEQVFDEALSGSDGQRRVIQDSRKRVVEDLADYVPARNGDDIHLTIDSRLQHAAYAALKAVGEGERARSAQALFIDVEAATILAAASWPGVNVNDRGDAAALQRGLRNRVALDVFEPGSTVKPLVVAAALERAVITPGIVLETGNGYWRVNGQDIRDTHGYGDVTLERMLSKSSNIAAAKIGMRLGAERLFQTYRHLGFGYQTGAMLGEESAGVLPSPRELGETVSSFGYGFNTTLLQLAQAWMALAGDGAARPISIIEGLPQTPVEPVFSPATAAHVRELLTAVVAPGGTATRAAIPGWSVAGKTGTVRKVVNGEYAEDRHQAMFVGMVPAHAPRILGLIVVDEPTRGRYYGGELAAPVFADVAALALRRLGVAPPAATRIARAEGDAS